MTIIKKILIFMNVNDLGGKILVSVGLNDGKKSPNQDSQKEDRGVLLKGDGSIY